MDVILSSPDYVKAVYIKGKNIVTVNLNPEVKPQNGIVALLNNEEVKRVRVFSFRKDKVNKNAIFEEVSNHYGTTDFIYDVYDWKNYYIVTVTSRKVYDLIYKLFKPTQIIPFDFVVLWNQQKMIRKPIIAYRGGLFYFISSTDVMISPMKEDIDPFISPATVVLDERAAKAFPELTVHPIKRRWKVNKKLDPSLIDDDVKNIEFALNSPINLLKETVTITDEEEKNKEMRYILSLTSALLIYLAIVLISPFLTGFVRLPVSQVSYNIPANLSNIDISFSFDTFVYRKAYPYTMYEAYDASNNQVAVFVVQEEAVKWSQQFPDYTVYKVVYSKDSVISKEYFTGKQIETNAEQPSATTTSTSSNATLNVISSTTATVNTVTSTTSTTSTATQPLTATTSKEK